MFFRTSLITLLLLSGFSTRALAQAERGEPVEETFRTFRVINGHSVETMWKGYLLFTITHRFNGTISEGLRELYGMDRSANIRLGLTYGVTDHLAVGAGRSRDDKIYDAFVKYRVWQQRTGGLPLSVTLLGSTAVTSREWAPEKEEAYDFKHRLSYLAQALIGSRLSPWLSLQVMPTLVHQNLAAQLGEENTQLSIGAAARFKLTETFAVLAEYYHRLDDTELDFPVHHPFGLAVDITRPKHSYQLQFTNTTAMPGQAFLTQPNDDFFKGTNSIHFGFRITRKFGL